MKLKITLLLITAILTVTVLAGCGSNNNLTPNPTDIITAASIVDSAAAFEKAISVEGKWIIAITKDITIDSDIVLDGDFKNGKQDADGKDILQRKIALYSQDSDRNITARFTLTAKSMTIESANASIQHGTFIGDLYVNVKDFQLIDATVDGDVYFLSEEIKASFTMDESSVVTGVQEVKP